MDELEILKERFRTHPSRHPSLSWDEAASALDAEKPASAAFMEKAAGAPDPFVCGYRLYMADFSREAPKRWSFWAGKRNLSETGVQGLVEAYGIALVPKEMHLALEDMEPLTRRRSAGS